MFQQLLKVRTEARYLTDEEAKCFLSVLLDEPDIRIKTALTIALFTGLRRGELCGLEWQDIDIENLTIHVRRTSQYISGHGVMELPTKNDSSNRDITVSSFLIDIIVEYRKWWYEHNCVGSRIGRKRRNGCL